MPLSLKLPRRNPDAPRQTLRERFAATREKYARTLKVHRALNAPPKPAPVDRIALVNYATWLYFERQRLCRELYPHMGPKAHAFILTNTAADEFHFPAGGFDRSTGEAPEPPSTRALQVLDLVGVDWRKNLTPSGRNHLDSPSMRDTGERPAMPYGWPALDAALVAAVSDLIRLDTVTNALLGGLPEDRDASAVPGYGELEGARRGVLGVLAETRAEGLPGLQAKARALMTPGVLDDYETTADIAHSLCRDLTGARSDIVEPRPDPVFAVLEEQRRLYREHDALFAQLGEHWDSSPVRPAEQAAHAAMWGHWREVVLRTVPRTAAGCRALAAYALEFLKEQGTDLDEEGPVILGLIARSPLL